MPTSLVWLSSSDSSFPPQLAQYLGDKAPSRIASIGNLDILKSKPIALICSVKCPGNIILQTYDLAQRLREAGVPVIGGFHSPMERECLRILLRGSQPVIVCPPRGLKAMRISSEHKAALEEAGFYTCRRFQTNSDAQLSIPLSFAIALWLPSPTRLSFPMLHQTAKPLSCAVFSSQERSPSIR